jgi:hypothetical protein
MHIFMAKSSILILVLINVLQMGSDIAYIVMIWSKVRISLTLTQSCLAMHIKILDEANYVYNGASKQAS